MANDEEIWPGGQMTGFILWMNKAKSKFSKEFPQFLIGYNISNYDAWGEFLQNLGKNKDLLNYAS